MEPTNPEEEVIVEEEVVEETPVEETPVEEPTTEEVPVEETPVEEPIPAPAPVLIHLPFTISNTRENLVVIALDRGYPTMVEKPSNTPDTPIQDRYMPNPVDPIVWLNDHIKDFLAGIASKPFIEMQKQAAQQAIDLEAQRVRQLARQSIS